MSKVLIKPLGTAMVLMSALALTACGAPADDTAVNNMTANSADNAAVVDGPARVRAELKSPEGEARGEAIIEQVDGALKLTVNGVSLPQGPHGAHIHTIGRCDAPEFTTAEGHWNPTARKHGLENPEGPHSGDFQNLDVGADGAGTLTADMAGAQLNGEGGLLDADGASFIIHAGPDDMKTDPSGNSGGRIACGVFVAQ